MRSMDPEHQFRLPATYFTTFYTSTREQALSRVSRHVHSRDNATMWGMLERARTRSIRRRRRPARKDATPVGTFNRTRRLLMPTMSRSQQTLSRSQQTLQRKTPRPLSRRLRSPKPQCSARTQPPTFNAVRAARAYEMRTLTGGCSGFWTQGKGAAARHLGLPTYAGISILPFQGTVPSPLKCGNPPGRPAILQRNRAKTACSDSKHTAKHYLFARFATVFTWSPNQPVPQRV